MIRQCNIHRRGLSWLLRLTVESQKMICLWTWLNGQTLVNSVVTGACGLLTGSLLTLVEMPAWIREESIWCLSDPCWICTCQCKSELVHGSTQKIFEHVWRISAASCRQVWTSERRLQKLHKLCGHIQASGGRCMTSLQIDIVSHPFPYFLDTDYILLGSDLHWDFT